MIYAPTVIMTTGGYGNNASLLKERFKQILYYGPKSATGDGLLMATIPALKAQTRAMDQGKSTRMDWKFLKVWRNQRLAAI